MNELTELRTSHSKTYDVGDGKRRVECSFARKHYNLNGQFADIDTNWENETGFGRKVQKADYHLRFFGRTLRFGFAEKIYVDYSLPCNLSFDRDSAVGTIDADTTIKYTATPDGIKMDIILSQCPKMAKSFSYGMDVKGCTAKIVENSLIFRDKEPVGQIPSPWMVDANGEHGEVTLDYVDDNIVFTPDFDFLQTAVYPVIIDPTTTLQTAASADDGFSCDSIFDTIDNTMYVGNTDASHIWGLFARFLNVSVPKDATINTAKIQYRCSASNSPVTCNTRIYFNATDNATAPTTIGEHTGKAVTSAYADWTIPAWTSGTWYDSPEIKTVIQEIVNRAGWVSGNAMMLLHKDNGSSVGAFRMISSYDRTGNTDGPKLVIEYSTATNATVDAVTATVSFEAVAPTVSAGTDATVQSVVSNTDIAAVAPTVSTTQNATVEAATATVSSEAVAPIVEITAGTITRQVETGADDGYIFGASNFGTAPYLFFGAVDGVYHGYARFTNVSVPKGVTITSAKIQYRANRTDTNVACNTRIYFNDEDNAIAPTSAATFNAKTLTSAYVDWTIPAWTADTWYDSPDIKDIVQEVIDRDGWQNGNAMLLLHKDNSSTNYAYRRPYAYESGSASATRLVVEFVTPTSVTVESATATLIFAAIAPTVSVNATVQAVVAAITVDAVAPAVSAGTDTTVQAATCNVDAAAITPEISTTANVNIAAETATVSVEAIAPTVLTGIFVDAVPANTDIAAIAPTIQTSSTITAVCAEVSFDAIAPTVAIHAIIAASTIGVSVSAPVPEVIAVQNITIEAATAAISMMAHAPQVRDGRVFKWAISVESRKPVIRKQDRKPVIQVENRTPVIRVEGS
jgi:hypothetical protein